MIFPHIKSRLFKANTILWFSIFTLFYACENVKPEEIAKAQEGLPQVIDFNFHVKPILSDKCFACHGPDKNSQKASLRLDTSEGAFAALTSGDGHAIVPGNLRKSQSFLRMISDNPDLKMPPPESHLSLTTKEIATLAKWIEQGAEYKPHWSFIPLTTQNIPTTQFEKQVNNPIDQFVLTKLESGGTSLSEVADKEALIRRASFSLIGLPPTPEQIKAFINDSSPNAYEKVIDRLLSSPAYGERMAGNWMDVARFTDSDGYLDDKHRDFSPYRDWVIKAFNKNMPYDQFASWQLAGDLIPNPTQESILATAFNRLHKKNSEAGIVFEEYRVEYVADRTNTFGKAFLGLSLECARCHDHKYDPVTQKNYYEVFGFFNSTHELGTAVYGPDQTPGPALMLASEVEQHQLDSLHDYITRLEQKKSATQNEQYAVWAQSNTLSPQTIKKVLERKLVAYYPFDVFKEVDSAKFSSPEARLKADSAQFNGPIIQQGKSGNAFFTSDYSQGRLGKKVGWFDRIDPFSIQFWLYPDTIYRDSHILWHCEDYRLGTKGYTISLEDNKVNFIMAHSWPQNALQVGVKEPLPTKKWTHLSITYDGSSKASGVQIYINGNKQALITDIDHLYKGILYEPDIHTYGFKGLTLGMRDKYVPFKKGGIDELKIYNDVLSAIEVKYSYDNTAFELPAMEPFFEEYFALNIDPNAAKIENELHKIRATENTIANGIQEIMVMGDLPEPRPTFVLERGVYTNPGEEVFPSTPASILKFDESLPRNRLGLSKWLFDTRNPLTARVFVNRIWQMHFGRGIVETSEDLGNQGSLPSHPELLDWLAQEFINSNWDIKYMHKLILMSHTFQQSSVITPEWHEKDPENILLARGPVFRLPAEMIRDNALAVSGLLEEHLGGSSAYPYQPAGLWNELTTKSWAYKYPDDTTKGIYRRSLYTIWKRTSPPPFLQLFDIANREVCTVRRKPTNTPLHALVLLNDPQFVEAARVLAEKTIENEETEESQIETVFLKCLGRTPTKNEFSTLMEFYNKELTQFKANKNKAIDYLSIGKSPWDKSLNPTKIAALGVVTNAIMNTDEAYTRR